MSGRIATTFALRRAAHVALAALVMLIPLCLGGAHVRVVQLGTAAVVVVGLLALAGRGFDRIAAPAWICLGLSIFCLLQTVPLPIGLLTVLSPRAADIWSRSLRPMGETVVHGSISLDPGATSVEAAKWAAYAIAASVAAAFARRRGAAAVIALVFLSAVGVAVATLGHALVGASTVFGVYEPRFSHAGWRIGPFLNANSLAGYLLLGSLCGLGIAFSDNGRSRRWAILPCVALMIAVIAVSGSRGGACATVLALLTFFGALASTSRRRIAGVFSGREWGVVAILFIAAPAIALVVAPDGWALLTQRDTDKLRLWRFLVPVLSDFPWFGLGRGAFESVFQAYRPPGFAVLYTHPENIAFQWMTEWGSLVAGSAFLGFAWFLRPARLRLAQHKAALGAMVGVLGLLFHNVVDLGLELFAPMLALMVICGACWGQVRRPAEERVPQAKRTVYVWFAQALAAFAVALAWVRGAPTDSFQRADLQNAYDNLPHGSANSPAVRDLSRSVRDAMMRHPAEPYFPRLGALLALGASEDALPWISRALELCPVDSRTHWILAQALRRHGLLGQALLEARLTAEYEPGLAPLVGTTVAGWTRNVSDVERAAPLGALGGVVLYYAALNAKERDLRTSLLRGATMRDPSSVLLTRALAEDVLAKVDEPGCPPAGTTACEEEVSMLANRLEILAPGSRISVELKAQLFFKRHQFEEAERLLSSKCPRLSEDDEGGCWLTLLRMIPNEARWRDLAEATARNLVNAACRNESSCEQAQLDAGDALARRSDWFGALGYYEKAAGRSPTPQALVKVADAAFALGQVPAAARALSMAANHARENPELLRQIEAKRQALGEAGYRPSGRFE